MTKTFMTATGANRQLQIKRSDDAVMIRQFDPEFHTHQAKTFFLNPSEAPALCLSILEAAGHKASPNGSFSVAACYLRQGIKEQERATAEAEELAELESEALELRNEFTGRTATEWAYPTTTAKEGWLAVARRAREMRNEKKVNTDD